MTVTRGVEQLLHGFADAVDQRWPERTARYFAPDAVFRPRGEPITGRPAIQAMYAARMSDERRRTRHLWANLKCEPRGDREVFFRATLTIYAFEPQVSESAVQMRIIDVEGLCEREDADSWVFKTHLSQPVFAAELPLVGPFQPPPQREAP